jgi:hypothetical protein
MSIEVEGQVGPQFLFDGASQPFRMDRSAALVVSEAHGRYYETTLRGAGFSAANQAAQAISVALATAYTGLLLYNPIGSGVNLVPNKIKFALSVAPAAIATLGLISGYAATGGVTAQTTPVAPTGNIIGASAGKGIALSSATIVTPVWKTAFVDGFTAAALPAPSPVIDLEGSILIPPGGFVAIGALTAVTGLGWISWEEISING